MIDKDSLEKCRRSMQLQKRILQRAINNSTDLKFIEHKTRKIEMINICREELRILIKQL